LALLCWQLDAETAASLNQSGHLGCRRCHSCGVSTGAWAKVAENDVSDRTPRVDEIDPDQEQRAGIQTAALGGIFAWRGDEVVLLAERSADSWILARGWAYEDRLVHIRRWSFPTAGALAGQVRRLAREASGNQAVGAAASAAALEWAAEQADTPS
jgi:hypothetical protein